VIPCYDEAVRLDPEAFHSALAQQPALSLSFVDDGSTDNTADVLRALCARCPERMRLLQLETNVGKAEAVRRGVLLALDRGPSIVGYFDADLATPLSSLPVLSTAFSIPAVQLVIGARVALMVRQVSRAPTRQYLGRVFATAASQELGLSVYDTQCGAKLFRNTATARNVFSTEFVARWRFEVEFLARSARAAAAGEIAPRAESGVEVTLDQWHDVSGSKLGLLGSARALAELGAIWARYRR
jgi:glycosyltransferase involved in cell wall biosynthesis